MRPARGHDICVNLSGLPDSTVYAYARPYLLSRREGQIRFEFDPKDLNGDKGEQEAPA